MDAKDVPFVLTYGDRTICNPDSLIKANDTVKVDVATGKITKCIQFDSRNLYMITGCRNLGRVDTVVNRKRHPGSFDIAHVIYMQVYVFANRLTHFSPLAKEFSHTRVCQRAKRRDKL